MSLLLLTAARLRTSYLLSPGWPGSEVWPVPSQEWHVLGHANPH